MHATEYSLVGQDDLAPAGLGSGSFSSTLGKSFITLGNCVFTTGSLVITFCFL